MPRPRKNVENEVETFTGTPVEAEANAAETVVQEEKEETAHTEKQEVQTVDVAALLAKMEAMQNEMDVLRNSQPVAPDGTVKMVYINPVSERNEVNLGDYGVLRGSTGYLEVDRRDFGGKFMTNTVRYLLDTKRLMVTDGLTADEKMRYKLDYPEDAVMSDRTFDHLLSMNTEDLEKMFSKLCKEHQQFVARRFITVHEAGDNRIGREKVERLNNLSKQNDPDGMFKPILQAMNKI